MSARNQRTPTGAISIHAPRTGSDIPSATRAFGTSRFQSTLPARGATCWLLRLGMSGDISIHAPRTGSDDTTTGRDNHDHDFNPRSPHGERLLTFVAYAQ